ncbi:hypothetical protein [Ekhidna sp.]|uniref:hypothetical protein n=1 Tax=Ekhidna sp. TaxID=2608089 RepID=UPI0032EB9BBF
MKNLLYIVFLMCGLSAAAQKKSEVDIVAIIDDLTVRWDETAIKMKNYQGIQEFCLTEKFRYETIELLDDIHHWDTTLYFIVQEKFDTSKDKEAAATLEDIEKLETEYSTANFKSFITEECGILKVIQDNFDKETVKQYEKDIRKFEKELVKYLNSITYRIDIIDEHIHHLDFN